MRRAQLYWRALVFLVVFTGAAPTEAQDRAKIEITPQIPHSQLVHSVAFSPDGTRLVSESDDDTLKLWDTASGQLIRTFVGDSGSGRSVAFSPDGMLLLSGRANGTVELSDATTGQLIRTFKGHAASLESVAFSPDGTRILSGGWDKTLKLWDAATGQVIRSFEGHADAITSVAFSPNGTRLLSGSLDKTLKLWDVATGRLIRTYKGHADRVLSVAFSPDGTRLLSGSGDKTLRLWDAGTSQSIRTLNGHSAWVSAVAYSPDGTRILSGGWDKTLKLWDAATGQLIHTYKGHTAWVTSVAFSPDGTRLLSGNADKTLKLWDTFSGQLIGTFEGRAGTVNSVVYSPAGAHLLSGNGDNMLTLWEAASGRLIRTFKGHAGSVESVAFSPDGTRILSGGWDKTLKLWDAATGQVIRSFEGHADSVRSVAFSPDGMRLLSGSRDKTIKLWDVATSRLIRTFEGHINGVRSVAFSPDGTRVLSGGWDKMLKLWDAATGQVIRTCEGHTAWVETVAFSPDGTRILSGGWDKTLKLWDAATGQVIRTFEGHIDAVSSVAFSPGGTRLLSGDVRGALKLWDAFSGRLLRTFEGHSGWVPSAAFSPDGRRVVSGSLDTTIRIWDADNGAQLAMLVGGRDGQWLALTSTGFFASSPSAHGLLAMIQGLDVTTIDQVHQSLFNPDLVRETLAGDQGGEVQEASKLINLEKVVDSGPAPGVAITSPTEGSQSAANLVAVAARIEDRGKGVGRVEWRVNGVTAAVVAKPEGTGPGYTLTRKVALDPGDNAIEVVAYNGPNLLASLPARTTIKFTGPAVKAKGKLYILAIGINAYEDKGWVDPVTKTGGFFDKLDLAVTDSTTFAAAMKKAGAGLYDGVRVTVARDKAATRANLRKLVDSLAAQIQPRDTFILFAAAHGYSLNGHFYLIPQDYQGGQNPEALATRAIGQDDLQDWLANRIRAKRALILLDTCESGALVASHLRSRVHAAASEAGVGRLHEATGRPVLTAAAEKQYANEDPIEGPGEKHGYFTWALLDALRKADADADGNIRLSSLVRHVQSVLPKIAANGGGTGEAEATTQSARFGSHGEDFVVARRLP